MTDSAPLRFVLLRHEVPETIGRASHWDLMIERAGLTQEHRLATWALESLPTEWTQLLKLNESVSPESILAMQLPDHRTHYLDYEGAVSEGRGVVTRCLSGTVVWVTESDRTIELELQISSPVSLAGVLSLVSKPSAGSNSWAVKWNGKPQ